MSLSHERPAPANPNATEAEQKAAREQVESSVNRRNGRRGIAAVVGGAVAAAVLGGGYFAVKGGGEANPTPERNPAASATPTPGGETEAPEGNTAETGYAPVELSVERYQDGDALIRAYMTERNKWTMSGVDKESTVDWTDPEGSIRSIAEAYDTQYIDALFVSNWEDNPALGEAVASFTNQHNIVLNASIMTTESGKPEDKEPYEQGDEITSTEVVESTADRMVVNYRHTMWSNADQNRGDMFIENVNGREGGATVTFVNENGVWKISDLIPFAG